MTAILMEKNVWVPLIAGVAIWISCTVLSLALPETLPVQPIVKSSESDSDNTIEADEKYDTWTSWLFSFTKSFAFATHNAAVLALIIAYLIQEIGRQSFDLLLQYVSKRYGWSLSNVSLQRARCLIVTANEYTLTGWTSFVSSCCR